jgi:hypothetical protein
MSAVVEPPQSNRKSTSRRRSHLATALAIAFTFMLTLDGFGFWAQDTVLSSSRFATSSVRLLDSGAVRTALADAITEKLVESGPSRLASFQTVLHPAIEQLLNTEIFRSIFRTAILRAQDAILTEDGNAAAINLSAALSVLSGSLQVTNPDLADSIPSGTDDFLVNVSSTLRSAQPWKLAKSSGEGNLRSLAILLVLAAAIVLLEVERRRGVFKVGIGIALAGTTLFALALSAPSLAASFGSTPSIQRALHDGAGIFFGSLVSLGINLAAIGIILCGFSIATRPDRPPLAPSELWAFTRARASRWSPNSPVGHIVRALVIMAIGYIVIVHRDVVAPLLVFFVGSYVVYLGVIELLSVVGRSDHRSVRSVVTDHAHDQVVRIRSHRILGATLALVIVIAAIGITVHAGSTRSEAQELRCNGYAELCDRHLDEVVFAASHNSMSARRDPGWLFAEHDQGIPAQLSYGIRALLVKTHYGIPSGLNVTGAPLVVTDQGAELATSTPEASALLTPEQQRQAAAIAASAKVDPSLRDVYLCHVNCELGATKFTDALRYLRQFLDANPNEVIMLVVGNYVSDADTEKAFREAKLFDRLWNVEPGVGLPTLREMIDARRNIVMFAEFGSAQPAWNSAAYGAFQDTPFTFRAPEELLTPGAPGYTGDAVVDGPVPDVIAAPTPTDPEATAFVPADQWTGVPSCAPNRGTPVSPMFQINHWVTPVGEAATAAQAKGINAYDVLMPRVRDCMAQRGRIPNIIGVNFYDKGDLLRVVNELNGVRSASR